MSSRRVYRRRRDVVTAVLQDHQWVDERGELWGFSVVLVNGNGLAVVLEGVESRGTR